MSSVSLEGVTKTYRLGAGEVHALRGVSLSIEEGEFAALLGPSGSGKTTLLQILGCVDSPTAGSVSLGGKSVAGLGDKELTAVRRSTVGFIFQQFYLMPTLTALENVLVPTLFGKRAGSEEEASELLDSVGLGGRAGHRVAQLSGGEMQRVAIARALINKPKLLLADEPTGNLDSENASAVFELFERLNRKGLTVIVVTHNEELAGRAKRIIRIKDGRLAGDSATGQANT